MGVVKLGARETNNAAFWIVSGRLGLHIQVDELLLYCTDRGSFLPQVLQLCVHQLVIAAPAEDGEAVVQLRGHSNELPGVACDEETAD